MSLGHPSQINIIAAVDSDLGIGKDGKIPWHIPADLQRFRALTEGGVVIMGRDTWQSLPKRPLPRRVNIVLSRTMAGEFGKYKDGAVWMPDLYQTLDYIAIHFRRMRLWAIGGQSLYEEVLNRDLDANTYITEVNGHFDCDRHFPSVLRQMHQQYAGDWQEEGGLRFRFLQYC